MVVRAESLRVRILGLRKGGDRAAVEESDGDVDSAARASSAGVWGTTRRFLADPPRDRAGAADGAGAEGDAVDESKLHSRWRGTGVGDGWCG
jgi:hypothetical protein